MKFFKLFLLLSISVFFSCKTINESSYLDSHKNLNTVKKIIDNYSTLETYLNYKILSDNFFFKYDVEYKISRLKEHIVKNKFYEGFKFEIKDSIEKIYHFAHDNNSFDTNSFEIMNLIKIKSIYNKNIIWFIFNYYEDQKIWKLSSIQYCNNYNERALGADVPCDKK
ncbi:MAG: hypothetical protein A2X64_00440 [Ignavibacteria bacterium GWF2_33_9]|nr:MAG: hypothetical protein A2X64_00440 [Ignavibacteria bacterium GWF2_33_9]